MSNSRTLTYEEFTAEATERFGEDVKAWAFGCPRCQDVATVEDFINAGVDAGVAGQECIGRSITDAAGKPLRGCNFAAYGLIPGPWKVLRDGVQFRCFAFAEVST